MKATKRILSLVLAFTLAISMGIPAFAEDIPQNASVGVSGDGTTEYVDLMIYDVLLPTSATFNFTLDPLGLLDIADGDEKSLDELDGGKIIPGADTPSVVNNSAFPVKLSAQFTVTGDATPISFTSDASTTIAAVEADTNNNVLLYVVPSGDDINSTGATPSAYASSGKGYIFTDNSITLAFTLDKADYIVKNTSGVYSAEAVDETGHGTAFQIGGYVNSKADWTDYSGGSPSKTVGVTAVFSIEADDSTAQTTYVTEVPGLIADNLPDEIPASASAKFTDAGFISSGATSKTISASGAAGVFTKIPFFFDGKDVSSVTVNTSPVALNTSYTFDKAKNEFQIKIGSAGAKTIVIKLAGDSSSYTLTYNVT